VNLSGKGPDAASLVSYQNLANDIQTRLGTTLPYALAVCSRYHGVDSDGRPVPRSSGQLALVVANTVRDAWRTQRRRAKQVL
jgi:hypothetical protein